MQNELFESASVPKAYMKLALPVVLSMMVSLVYNMVDTYFIALTGKQELVAGVSLAAPIFTLMIAFGDIFGLGGSSLISRLFGEKREEEAKRASAFCLWAAIGFGIFVTIVLLVFRTPILKLLGTDAAHLSMRASIIRGSQSEQLLLYWGLCRAIFCGRKVLPCRRWPVRFLVPSSILFWIRSLSLDWDRELRERRWQPLSEM